MKKTMYKQQWEINGRDRQKKKKKKKKVYPGKVAALLSSHSIYKIKSLIKQRK